MVLSIKNIKSHIPHNISITSDIKLFNKFNFQDRFNFYKYCTDNNLFDTTNSVLPSVNYKFSYYSESARNSKYEGLNEIIKNTIYGKYERLEISRFDCIYGVNKKDYSLLFTSSGAYFYAKIAVLDSVYINFPESSAAFPVVLIPDGIKEQLFFPSEGEILVYKPTLTKPVKPFEPILPSEPSKVKSVPYNKTVFNNNINYAETILMYCLIFLSLLLMIFVSPAFIIMLIIMVLFAIKIDNPLFRTNTYYRKENKTDQEYQYDLKKFEVEKNGYSEKLKKYNINCEAYTQQLHDYFSDLLYNGLAYLKEHRTKSLHALSFPERSSEKAKKGKSELFFLEHLLMHFPDGEIKANMSVGEFIPPYYPDFVYSCSDTNLHIDIEIDEPYTLDEKEPIHFVDNRDSKRNLYFLDSNWVVIRFCEEQIVNFPEECCLFIKDLISFIKNPEDVKIIESNVPQIKCWSYEEALLKGYKNTRLNNKK